MFGVSGSYSNTDQASAGPLSVTGGGQGVSPWLIGVLAVAVIVGAVLVLKILKGK